MLSNYKFRLLPCKINVLIYWTIHLQVILLFIFKIRILYENIANRKKKFTCSIYIVLGLFPYIPYPTMTRISSITKLYLYIAYILVLRIPIPFEFTGFLWDSAVTTVRVVPIVYNDKSNRFASIYYWNVLME